MRLLNPYADLPGQVERASQQAAITITVLSTPLRFAATGSFACGGWNLSASELPVTNRSRRFGYYCTSLFSTMRLDGVLGWASDSAVTKTLNLDDEVVIFRSPFSLSPTCRTP